MMSSTDSFHVRRLYAAPDNTTEVLATTDRGAVTALKIAKDGPADARVQLIPDTDDTPRVSLPFPATDVAWCPFKSGDTDASFLTSCRSQPLQLWDLSDGSLRASYVALSDSGMNAHPRAVLWLSGPFQNFVAGAYGGTEDATQVRFFDLAVEGDQCVYGYRSPAASGPVSALGHCAPLASSWAPPANVLVLAGYLHHNQVDCIDYRQHCAAAILRGPVHGGSASVSCLRTTPLAPHLVFAAGRGGAGAQSHILCWDLRKPGAVLSQFARRVETQQLCDFALVPDTRGDGVRLVSTTTDAGLLLFDDVARCEGTVTGTASHADAGITSGLAALSATEVVVAVGSREYDFTSRGQSCGGLEAPRGAAPSDSAHAVTSDDDEESAGAAVSFVHRKRTRTLAALSESDDEGSVAVKSSAGASLNVRVLSLC